jgi:hypothetical protein
LDRTIRRPIPEWAEDGLSETLQTLVLDRCDRMIGLELGHLAVDGSITKALAGGGRPLAGRSRETGAETLDRDGWHRGAAAPDRAYDSAATRALLRDPGFSGGDRPEVRPRADAGRRAMGGRTDTGVDERVWQATASHGPVLRRGRMLSDSGRRLRRHADADRARWRPLPLPLADPSHNPSTAMTPIAGR